MKTKQEHSAAGAVISLDRPVVLIGLMGAGKTRIGRLLGEALGVEFIDSDDEIEKAAGMSVADIFECFGEKSFRDGEARVLRRLLGDGVKVIATGGGAVMTPETADLIWNESLSIWLKADIPVILERTARTDKRPLLQVPDPERILRALVERRDPVYQRADIVIESGDEDAERVLEKVLEALRRYSKEEKE